MAAKPPKPPGHFLKQDNNYDSANNITKTTSTPSTPAIVATDTNFNRSISEINNGNSCDALQHAIDGAGAPNAPRPTCSCTNISIMHLFHEMKQKFPTIPDTIVAQCVNQNCHQRENCMQMLRNELDLNPIPAQSYPAKVLHHHHQQQQQQQQQKQQQDQPPLQPQPPLRVKSQKPPTPLKPVRAAPGQPPAAANASSNATLRPQLEVKGFPANAVRKQNCDSDLINCNSNNNKQNSNNNLFNHNENDNNKSNSNNFAEICSKLKDVQFANSVNCNSVGESEATSTSDMPATTTTPIETANAVNDVAAQQQQRQHGCLSDFTTNLNNSSASSPAGPLPTRPIQPAPRVRPNTLNLQTQQQAQQLQLQRQQVNIQLQQHFQQRNLQSEPHQKPIRKAPLPPIAPKPVFGVINHNNNNNCTSPQSQGSYSNESNLTSPISSGGESEISVNVSLSSPTSANALNHNSKSAFGICQQHSQLKSPIRHRSVITVQPEPPYTRDFLGSPTTQQPGGGGGFSSSTSTATTPTSQKSFTSVNLTLRQPNSAVPQSTIDISAGPALCGSGSGLTYSSTSYDARRGYQKNFHITVTDKGGVFNASRMRPRSCYYPGGEQETDGPGAETGKGGVNPLRTVASEHNVLRATQPATQQQQQQQQQQYIVANNSVTTSNQEMCLPREADVCTETLQRQKARRDKLATALRENKKRLGHVEEEINMLTEPVNPGESVRLDHEIERLRSDCHLMLNEIEKKRAGPSKQQPQQAFPRQRPPRPPPPAVARSPIQQPDLDFVQHHSSATSTPNSPHMQHQISLQGAPTVAQPSPVYQQVSYYQPSTDEDEYSDSNTDGGDDEEPLEMWSCSMCTFRNHPQLNICECCENIRKLSGMMILPSAATAAAAVSAAAVAAAAMPPTAASATAAALSAACPAAIGTATPSNSLTPAKPNANSTASLENDSNLTQQQFALHT